VAEPARAEKVDFKPHLFGKFFLLQRLAVGGMAEIYRAKVIGAGGFEKELAVKRILPQRSQDRGFITMLVNEAKLTAQLTHSNVAQIYECGAVDGTYFIAMELVHGVSLKEVMASFSRSGVTLTPEQAIFIVLQLLHGLDYAHRKTDAEGERLEIVHCDVSPDNALVSWEGEVKLLDFGIARAATGLSNYKEGMLMGKLGYVAPEQASIEKTWDHRVDLFAAGIILYELLTKQKPFPKATDVESLVQARKARVTPPSALDERIPKDLDAILMRALAYDPDKRYPTARAFADALVDVLFPTPHSAVQDLLGSHMKEVFGDRILRQRAARAHDALVMKVLQHVLDKEGADRRDAPAAATAVEAVPVELEITSGREVARAPARLAPPRPPPRRGPGWKLALAAVALVALGAAAAFAAQPWLRPGVLVVTSSPPGALVTVDGRAAPTPTPAVIEGVALAQPLTVVVTAPDRKVVTLALEPELATTVRRVHADLPDALGAVTVESEPSGAEVLIDERPAGTTPLTIHNVRLDERHRFDLALPGHELDQFVVLPEKDGQRFHRRLAPASRRGAAGRAEAE
jgi:eukaryotic-like serine/threonine-protein kinase